MLLELVLMGNTDWFKHFVLWVMVGSQYCMMIGVVIFQSMIGISLFGTFMSPKSI